MGEEPGEWRKELFLRSRAELVGPRHWMGKALFICSYKFYMCECFTCMYVCILHACLVPEDTRGGCQVPWDSGSCHVAAVKSSGRALNS